MLILMVILIPVIFVLVMNLLTYKYKNPWKLYMIFGKKGSGKSTYLVKIAIKYLRRGYIVYTTMADMKISGLRLIDPDTLGDFIPDERSVLLLDEAGTLYDNREFKKFKASTRDFYKYQRHYKCIVYLASQTWDIDKKLRDLTDSMYLHVCLFNVISIGKRIVRKVTLTESTSEAESRIADNLKFAAFWYWSCTYIPRYAKYFDSYNVPVRPRLDYATLEGFNVLRKKDVRKLLK